MAVVSYAAQCTGVNGEYLSRADNASLSIGDLAFWLTIWAFMDSKANLANALITKYDGSSANAEYEFIHRGPGGGANRFSWRVASAAGSGRATLNDALAGVVALQTWNHLFVWYDPVAAVIGMIVNGGAAQTTAHTGGAFDGTGEFEIGQERGQPLAWDGRLAFAALGKSPPGGFATTPATTIAGTLCNNGHGLDLSVIDSATRTAWGGVSAWRLQEASGSRADIWGSNTLTDNNTVTQAAGPLTDYQPIKGQYATGLTVAQPYRTEMRE